MVVRNWPKPVARIKNVDSIVVCWLCTVNRIITYNTTGWPLLKIPIQASYMPIVLQYLQTMMFRDSRHMNVATLSALLTGRLYSTRKIPGTHSCQRPSRPQGHSAAGTTIAVKNPSQTIGLLVQFVVRCNGTCSFFWRLNWGKIDPHRPWPKPLEQ